MSGYTIDLGGRVAVVTGGGSGIGEATAKLLAHAGAAVAVADLSEENAKRVVTEIEAVGGRALAVACDVCDEVSVADALPRSAANSARCGSWSTTPPPGRSSCSRTRRPPKPSGSS